MSFTTFDERIALSAASQIAPGDTTTAKSFWTTDAQVRRVDSILLSSTDTVDRYVQFSLNLGATDQQMFEVLVPAGAGHGVVPVVEVFATINQANLIGLVVGPSCVLRWNAVVTITTAKVLQAVLTGGIF
jgi:hypothetical protein